MSIHLKYPLIFMLFLKGNPHFYKEIELILLHTQETLAKQPIYE